MIYTKHPKVEPRQVHTERAGTVKLCERGTSHGPLCLRIGNVPWPRVPAKNRLDGHLKAVEVTEETSCRRELRDTEARGAT
jgi:hypothetical protein